MNQGYKSILIDATPSKQKSRVINETSRLDSLFNQHCTETIMTIYTVDLHFWYFSETRPKSLLDTLLNNDSLCQPACQNDINQSW